MTGKSTFHILASFIISTLLLSACTTDVDTENNESDTDTLRDEAINTNENRFSDLEGKEDDANLLTNVYYKSFLIKEVSELAAGKASQVLVKRYAEESVRKHGAMNNQIQQLAIEQNISLPSSMSEDVRDAMAALEELEDGRVFDEEYMEFMTEMHSAMYNDMREPNEITIAPIRDWVLKTANNVMENQQEAHQLAERL